MNVNYPDSNQIVYIVKDREGRQYNLEVNNNGISLYIGVMYQDDQVGELKSTFKPNNDMLLNDVIIYNEVIPHCKNLASILCRLIFEPKLINFRKRGLGTHLLQSAIREAQKQGAKRIDGYLVQTDLDENPNLINWYRKHGFQIIIPYSDNDGTDAVAGITMTLT